MNKDQIINAAETSLQAIAHNRPRVHILTNFVAMNVTANCVLALGAVPSMTMDETSIEDFVGSSKALVVNLGQFDPWREACTPKAIQAAKRLGLPWVLDPVKIDRSPARRALAGDLIELRPSLIRCNSSEAEYVRSLDGSVVAETGAIDRISDGRRAIHIANGSPMMDRVTAMGCALSAVAGCFLAVEDDHFLATAAALLCFDIAGEIAAETAAGPGSFAANLLDALYALNGEQLRMRANIS